MTCTVEGCEKPHVARGWCSAHWYRWRHHGDPLAGGPQLAGSGEAERYYREVVLPYEGDECLIWPFGNGRYGKINHGGKTVSVHRRVCEETNGVAPSSAHQAAHSCGNGHLRCVAQRHLSWKTPKENQADRVAHGTDGRGERGSGAKLTEQQVRQIIALRGQATQQEIARRFQVSKANIKRIYSGRTWSHLKMEA